MEYKLIIDEKQPETVVVTAHQRSPLTDAIEALLKSNTGTDRIYAYTEDEMKLLLFAEIECITILNGKTYAIDKHAKQYRLKQRLYELESILPTFFIRINKSAFANENRLERFAVTYSGAVDAVFKCGYREYVSRRCFAQIKRRFNQK